MSHKFRLFSWRGKFGDRGKKEKEKPTPTLASTALTYDDGWLSAGSCLWQGPVVLFQLKVHYSCLSLHGRLNTFPEVSSFTSS